MPLRCQGRILHLDIALHVKRRLKGFIHELLEYLFVYPGAADADFNLAGVQVFGLRLFQRLHVDVEIRVPLCRTLCLAQLLSYIAGEIFIRRLPAFAPVFTVFRVVKGTAGGLLENNAFQIIHNLWNLFRPAHEGSHESEIHTCFFSD